MAQDEELPGEPWREQPASQPGVGGGQGDRWGFGQRGWSLGDRDGVGEREEQGIEIGKQNQRRQTHRREKKKELLEWPLASHTGLKTTQTVLGTFRGLGAT